MLYYHISILSYANIDSTCLVSQDSTCLVSQDSTCLVSQDSICVVSQDSTCQGCQEHRKLVVSGTNVVAMARHGPILKDNEATGSGKVFRYLPGLRDTIKNRKWPAKSQNPKTLYFTVFSYKASCFMHRGVQGKHRNTRRYPAADIIHLLNR